MQRDMSIFKGLEKIKLTHWRFLLTVAAVTVAHFYVFAARASPLQVRHLLDSLLHLGRFTTT